MKKIELFLILSIAGYAHLQASEDFGKPTLKPDTPGEDAEHTVNARARKTGSGSGTGLDWNYCSDSSLCTAGHGDCDSDAQCSGDLTCGQDNCKDFNSAAHSLADCCIGGVGFISDRSYCSSSNVCSFGQGDCDSDSHCSGSLVCGTNNCRDFHPNAHSSADCCIGCAIYPGYYIWKGNNCDKGPKNSFQDCANWCAESKCCKAWTFRSKSDSDRDYCWLKLSSGEMSCPGGECDNSPWISGTKEYGVSPGSDLLFLTPSKIVELPSFKQKCTAPPYPGAQHRTVSGLVNGFLMTCGGYDKWPPTSKSCYSLEHGVWHKKDSMLVPSAGASSSKYPMCGLIVTPYTEMFSSGSWKAGAKMPKEVSQACQVTLGTTVIVMGGYSRQTGVFALPLPYHNWTTLASLNLGRFDHACAVLGDTVYVMGGQAKGGATNTVEKFKLGWKNWERVTNLPILMLNGQAVVFENKLYCITNTYDTAESGKVYRLDDDETKWTEVANVGAFSAGEQFNPAQVLTPSSVGC